MTVNMQLNNNPETAGSNAAGSPETGKNGGNGQKAKTGFLGHLNRQTEILRRRIWPAALAGLFYLFYFVGGVIGAVTRTRAYAEMYHYTAVQERSEMLATVSKVIGLRQPGFYFTILLAVILAVQGFSWLDSKQKIDFYESQPVSRKQRFRGIYWNSILIFAVPYLVSMLLGIIVAAGMGAMCGIMAAEAFCEFLRMLILFLGVYAISSLASMLTGNVIVACMASVVLLGYEWAFVIVLRSYAQKFFATYYYNNAGGGPLLSPIYNYMILQMTQQNGKLEYSSQYYGEMTSGFLNEIVHLTVPKDLITLCIWAGVSGLAYLCYVKRKNESAGSAVIFPAVRFVVKIGVALLGALYAGDVIISIFSASRNTTATVIVLLGIVIGAAVICCVIEIIYSFNFHAAFRGAWQIAIAAAAGVLIFVGFRNDLTGYDRYAPNPSSVESCALFSYDYTTSYYFDTSSEIKNSDDYFARYMKLTDVADVEKVALTSQKYTADMQKASAEGNADSSGTQGYQAAVLYRLKNGRMVYRSFTIPAAIDPAAMDAVTGTEEYREGYFPMYHDAGFLNGTDGNGATMTYDAGYGQKTVSADDYDGFKKAYAQDIVKFCYSFAHANTEIGSVTLTRKDLNDTYGSSQISFPVYPGYGNTIAWLKANDLWMDTEVSQDDVQSVTVTNSHNDLYQNQDQADPVGYQDLSVAVDYTDKASIAKILENCYPANLQGEWKTYDMADTNYSVQVTMKSTHKSGTSLSSEQDPGIAQDSKFAGGWSDNVFYYNFRAGQVPDFVASDTAREENAG
jgi:ABC-2 type transport system permease protein